ncbi:MAG: ABC transporter ATP-binding protein, partial [Alphaproteobacteria bacterium]|nr:ABC transporter ATP-binding protein [Alphaproteobacteria bacterium]
MAVDPAGHGNLHFGRRHSISQSILHRGTRGGVHHRHRLALADRAMTVPAPRDVVLSVRDLTVEVAAANGPARIIDRISFDVGRNEVFSVVGESGSGKSITMLAIMGLLPPERVRLTGGAVWLNGEDLVQASPERRRRLRGNRLSMIFQDPMTSLNPVLSVGGQIGEIVAIHRSNASPKDIRDRVLQLLTLVGIPDPERRYRQYPHEFSGGMRQRAMIAMAMANEPAVLIADEPTTALDVTIQAQIMDVLAQVRDRTGASMILVTHDLGLVAESADRMAVMYGGRIVETGAAADIFAQPAHPYTVGLLRSLPRFDRS